MKTAFQRILFPLECNGRHAAIAGRIDDAIQDYRRPYFNGYRTPVQRAGTVLEFNSMASGLAKKLSGNAVPIGDETMRRALVRTFWLNPNVTLGNGKFIFKGSNEGGTIPVICRSDDEEMPLEIPVKVEQKRCLVESLVKAVIGESETLCAQDFLKVASLLNDPRLFADVKTFDPEAILVPLPEHNGVAGDRPDNCWSPERIEPSLKNYSAQRAQILEANRKYFEEMFRIFPVRDDTGEKLEVGSGLGNFRAMIPQRLWPSMIHMDWNTALTAYVKKHYEGARAETGNIYDIPFPDAAFENVFGLTPFVSLYYLDHAMAQIHRVLKPGGTLFAFQDIIPNDNQMSEQLVRRGLFPYRNRTAYSTKKIDSKKFLLNMALDASCKKIADRSAWEQYLKVSNGKMVIQNCYEYLHHWLVNEMKYAGFDILYAGFEKVFEVAMRQIHHVDVDHSGSVIDPDVLFRFQCVEDGPFHMQLEIPGELPGDIRRAIGPDRLIEYSIIWAVVGRKRE
ncbi:MAG: methyltransferase domain-containing protein [Candidatus Saganbacteria bacterium]|nr:methyltransferase domain-containing protein [Candidatus Saganbacteria bacterium]